MCCNARRKIQAEGDVEVLQRQIACKDGWLSDDLECGRGVDPSCWQHKLEAAEALARALAELKEHPVSCGCVAKQGGFIYTTVCARHREQGHEVGRRFGDNPAEAQAQKDSGD